MIPTFPGGTSVTLLDVYEDVATDGLRGGSPHMHLASSECYVVIGGHGALHTIDMSGVRETELRAGSVVWFTPGTIHRSINHGNLRILVIMGNAGLPEAGDAVMTFAADIVADPARYASAAALPAGSLRERMDGAAHRRDQAVAGFLAIRDAAMRGDLRPLQDFYAAAATLVEMQASSWADIVASGPLLQAQWSRECALAIASGELDHLAKGGVRKAPQPTADRRFGMCGRLVAYDVRDHQVVHETAAES